MQDHRDNLFKGLKIPDTKEAKKKMLGSDIFNLKKVTENTYTTNTAKEGGSKETKQTEIKSTSGNINQFFDNPELAKRNELMQSDVFFLKKNPNCLARSYDALRVKSSSPKIFGSCTESESGWHPRNSKANLLNYPSGQVNILNPSIKGFACTKEEVYKLDEKYCTHKKKSIAEYVDLFRNFCPNKNEKYMNSLNTDNGVFKQRKEVCSQYGTLFNRYNPMIPHPFTKKQ